MKDGLAAHWVPGALMTAIALAIHAAIAARVGRRAFALRARAKAS
jgi:hypothetical protein